MELRTCITDATLYTFKAILLLDVFGWMLVGMDRRVWWTRCLFLFNVGFVTMVMMRVVFPDPDFMSADALYSASGIAVMILLGIALRTAVVGMIVSAIVGSVGLGVSINYAEGYFTTLFETTFGLALTHNTAVIIAIVVFVMLVVAYVVFRQLADIAMTLMRSGFLSIMVGVGIHTTMNNNIINTTTICCYKENTDKCPIWLTPMDYGIIVGLFMGRLVVYMSYKLRCGEGRKKDESCETITKKDLREALQGATQQPLLMRDNMSRILSKKKTDRDATMQEQQQPLLAARLRASRSDDDDDDDYHY